MTQKQTSEPKPWFVGEPFEQMVGLLIAIVTLLASVTGYLQVQADGASTKASNQGQQFALQSIGGRARGEILAGYAWSDAYRTWLALDTQAVLSKNAGDAVAAQDFLTARDRISTLTPLLQPPISRTPQPRTPQPAPTSPISTFWKLLHCARVFSMPAPLARPGAKNRANMWST